LGEPRPTGSPTPTPGAAAASEVIKTLHQLIDTLSELSAGNARGPMPHPQRDLPLLLDADEAASALSLSRAKVFAMASRGEIPSVRIGRSLRIPRDPLVAWVEGRTSEPNWLRGRRLPAWTRGDGSLER
jgi:excisionase family DNA binding protein